MQDGGRAASLQGEAPGCRGTVPCGCPQGLPNILHPTHLKAHRWRTRGWGGGYSQLPIWATGNPGRDREVWEELEGWMWRREGVG